jgi:diacylglycerol kinase (ATP)
VGWVLLRNAAAGSDDAERVTAVAGGLARHGPTEVVASDGQADVDEALLGAEGRVVVVCGGDGSVQLAVERARALGLLDDLVLGIVPSGTGNDLAGALDLPTTPVELVELLASSRARTLDLLVTDDDRVVVNAVHVGVGVDAAERASDLKDAAGRLAYPLGAVIAGVSAEGLEVRVEVDGGRVDLDRPALMVVVANGPTIGGGTPVAPAASPDDGQLDVVVVHAVDRTARLAFAAALLRGAHVDREDVVVARGASVTVAGRRLAHNRDGELEEPRGATRGYRVEPRCWRVLA